MKRAAMYGYAMNYVSCLTIQKAEKEARKMELRGIKHEIRPVDKGYRVIILP